MIIIGSIAATSILCLGDESRMLTKQFQRILGLLKAVTRLNICIEGALLINELVNASSERRIEVI